MNRIFIGILICISCYGFSQQRFKFQVGGGATSSNLTSVSIYVLGEQRVDINKGFKIGLGIGQIYYQIPQNDVESFYKEFYENKDFATTPLDSIYSFEVNLNSLLIPIGYSFYLSPRFYLDYTLEFNLITGSDYNLIDSNEDLIGDFYKLGTDFFKRSYTTHNIGAYRVYWRRLELGGGVQFTAKKTIIKPGTIAFEKQFNSAFSKYVGFFVNLRYYFYQNKATKI